MKSDLIAHGSIVDALEMLLCEMTAAKYAVVVCNGTATLHLAASVRSLITPGTKKIVAVDFTGQSVEHDELRAICKEHDLNLIENAAHAIGTKI